MLYFKNKHVLSEQQDKQPVGDFFSPVPKANEQETDTEAQPEQDTPAQESQDA